MPYFLKRGFFIAENRKPRLFFSRFFAYVLFHKAGASSADFLFFFICPGAHKTNFARSKKEKRRRIRSFAAADICVLPQIKKLRFFRGICSVSKKKRKKTAKINGFPPQINLKTGDYKENSSNVFPVERSIHENFPSFNITKEWGEFSFGKDTEPQFR